MVGNSEEALNANLHLQFAPELFSIKLELGEYITRLGKKDFSLGKAIFVKIYLKLLCKNNSIFDPCDVCIFYGLHCF